MKNNNTNAISLLAAAAVLVSIRLYQRERILFSTK
jgi:hypothetical protein